MITKNYHFTNNGISLTFLYSCFDLCILLHRRLLFVFHGEYTFSYKRKEKESGAKV